ncbi:hypothetical protein cm3_195 [Escherichia phage JoYop]|nr:hypothetical protein cm3_195 [Escherichia phage JoYop]
MMLEGTDYIHDYRGSAVYVGDEVAVYYGYGTLMTAKVIQIKITVLNSKFIILMTKSLFLSGNMAIAWSNWGKYDLRY